MKRSIDLRMAVVAAVLMFAFAMSGLAQQAPKSPRTVPVSVQAPLSGPSVPGVLFIPQSSVAKPPQPGKLAAHTNVEIYVPSGQTPDSLPPFPGYAYETPQSLECVYGLTSNGSNYPNCNPNNSALNTATVGSETIAIVDAYDNPAAGADLAWFSLQFGIPLSVNQFQVVWANTADSSCPGNYGYGVPTDYSGGWEVEESLDVQWAHAMAPGAKLYLVEACSNYNSDLQQAVLVATNLVQCGNSEINPSTYALGSCPSTGGIGEVSMSWGEGEFSGETGTSCGSVGAYANPLNDACFNNYAVTYFASAGDGPGVSYPCASPNVVCAGGTTNRRNAATANFEQETAWVDGGGGESYFEPLPTYYQSGVGNCTALGGNRCVPDLSFDADPYTGVYVYDTFPVEGFEYYQWLVVGGTSASAPSLAGIANNASTTSHTWAGDSQVELLQIYYNRANASDFTDITVGYCGFYMGLSAETHWDPCTGVGVPNGFGGLNFSSYVSTAGVIKR